MPFKFNEASIKIPIRYHFIGDKRKSQLLVPLARRLQYRLISNSGFQNLKQNISKIVLTDGSIITNVLNHNINDTYINVKPITKIEEKKELKDKCLCFPCFSLATILNIRQLPTETNKFTYSDLTLMRRINYDIEICLNTRYIALENFPVRSSGAEIYNKGQLVFITVDNASPRELGTKYNTYEEKSNCCKNSKCIASTLSGESELEEEELPKIPTNFIIVPMALDTEMKKWVYKR